MGVRQAQAFLPPFLSLLFVSVVTASLFFNGMHAEYFYLAMCLLIIWVAVLCWQGIKYKRSFPAGQLVLALGLFQGWLLITLAWNPIPYLGEGYFWLLAAPLLVVIAWGLAPFPEQLWRCIWPMLLVLSFLLIFYALYQYYWLSELPHATFVNRNSLAAMLNLLMLIAVSRIVCVEKQLWPRRVLLLTCIVLMSLLVGLVGSRGAFLGLVVGALMLLVWGGVYQPALRSRIFVAVAAVGVGIAVSNLDVVNVQKHQLVSRMGALSDPYSAGNSRFLIWGQSLKMAQEKPLSGYGLGTYWQYWPQWRDPKDGTGGFWAHNDFLHLWVEAGLPAVVLLLFVHVALLALFLRILRSASVSPNRKAEVVALFAGILAVAVHAQFTFNYYNLPVLLVLSLMMARIARIEWDAREAKASQSGMKGGVWLRPVVALSALLLVLHFSSMAVAVLVFKQAAANMQQGNFVAAEQGFSRAQVFWGKTDMLPYTHALLKEQQLANTSPDEVKQRKKLFAEAQQLLDRASQNNPLRAISYFIRGRVLVTAAELAGEDWLETSQAAFRKSLLLNPLYIEPRITLARILEVTGRQDEARDLLEAGTIYHYSSDDPNTLTYYKMLADARHRDGDAAGASDMIARYNKIIKMLAKKEMQSSSASTR